VRSGLQSVLNAAMQVNLIDRLVTARRTPGGRFHLVPGGMLETAENVRRKYGIPREEPDAPALQSDQRAVAAQESGRFNDEIAPVVFERVTLG
jgi:acetyl-CoA C-acetyltransferase